MKTMPDNLLFWWLFAAGMAVETQCYRHEVWLSAAIVIPAIVFAKAASDWLYGRKG